MEVSFKHGRVADEYRRWTDIVGKNDPYFSRTTIGLFEVLHAHFLLVDYFFGSGEGLGGVGPKNIDLLHSALSRQFSEFGGKPKWTDRVDTCASLMYGLIKNHPFHDANKRTAFLTSILHLQKIGRTPTASHTAYEDFTVAISDDKLQEYPTFDTTYDPSPDKEVKVMAHFLKKNSRQIDLKNKTVTYNELNRILARRGLYLDNPKGNRIDLIRRFPLDDAKGLSSAKRIAHIGFHGWSKQASEKDISIVREAAHLDARHGYDSQAFFNGLDDPLTIINKYKEPIERLAFR